MKLQFQRWFALQAPAQDIVRDDLASTAAGRGAAAGEEPGLRGFQGDDGTSRYNAFID
jgi:hypothetical protein